VSGDAETAIAAAIAGLDSTGATSDSGHYLTAITITDGKFTAVGQEALPTATPVTTVNGTTGTSASPVLTGIVTGGTDGHELTLNYSNMVSSAMTSQSADVATNAVHASAATKVDSALTLTDVDGTNNVVFDGSANKTVTFGTATSITGENSMSMSDAGVVDVNIIDCGTY
jgi:type IV secretory pathway VirJ component